MGDGNGEYAEFFPEGSKEIVAGNEKIRNKLDTVGGVWVEDVLKAAEFKSESVKGMMKTAKAVHGLPEKANVDDYFKARIQEAIDRERDIRPADHMDMGGGSSFYGEVMEEKNNQRMTVDWLRRLQGEWKAGNYKVVLEHFAAEREKTLTDIGNVLERINRIPEYKEKGGKNSWLFRESPYTVYRSGAGFGPGDIAMDLIEFAKYYDLTKKLTGDVKTKVEPKPGGLGRFIRPLLRK